MFDFFGFNDYDGRVVEGAYSWQHLTFVTSLLLVMVALAIYFGLQNKDKDEETKKVQAIAKLTEIKKELKLLEEQFDILHETHKYSSTQTEE